MLCGLNAVSNENGLIKVIIVLAVVCIILLIIKWIVKKKKEPDYFVKESLLTSTEIKYYDIIRSILGDEFLLLPQINLATVIDKKGGSNFRNELFRNIDFGIFDYNFKPLVLIEINDNTHFKKDRKERDKKVSAICKKAQIPLVTFWVKDGIDHKEITKKIYSALNYSRRIR